MKRYSLESESELVIYAGLSAPLNQKDTNMKPKSSSQLFSSLAVCALGCAAVTAHAQPAKAFGSSNSNVKKPSSLVSLPVKEVDGILGGRPNSSVAEAGFDLSVLVGTRISEQRVYKYAVTGCSTMVANEKGFQIMGKNPRPQTMFMIVAVGTDGKVKAAAQWWWNSRNSSGAVTTNLGMRPNMDLMTQFFTDPRGKGQPASITPGIAEFERDILLPMGKGANPNGPMGMWMMTGRGRDGIDVSAGFGWGPAEKPRGSDCPPVIVTDYRGVNVNIVPSIGLAASFTRDSDPQLAKIVPTTNDQAVKQAGAK